MESNIEDNVRSTQNTENKHVNGEQIKLYKRRWLMLILVLGYSIANTSQNYQYSSIAHIISNYYSVSYTAVNWTSLIPMINNFIFCIPGYYLINRIGVRYAVLFGAIGTAIGAWIKVFAVHPDRFWAALVGQGVNSILYVFVSPIPPKLAASWFGDSEISTACSLALIGTAVGSTLGYVMPSFLTSSGPYKTNEENLLLNFLIMAIFSTVMLPLIFFGFQETPLIPPSIAQLKIKNTSNIMFSDAMKCLVTNKSFMLFLLISGINLGSNSVIAVMGNQVISYYYPNLEHHVGTLGIVVAIGGITGALTGGIILDKLKKFKQLTLGFYTCFLLSMVVRAFGLSRGIAALYAVEFVQSIFYGATSITSYQLSLELTYPQPEEIAGGLIATVNSIFGFGMSYVYSIVHYSTGNFWANILLCMLMFLTDLLFLLIKFNLRRQAAQE